MNDNGVRAHEKQLLIWVSILIVLWYFLVKAGTMLVIISLQMLDICMLVNETETF